MDTSKLTVDQLHPHDWNIHLDKQFPTYELLVSDIRPVQPNVAVMVTNSFASIPIDKWIVMARFMTMIGDMAYTTMKVIGTANMLSEAMDIAREWAWLEYGQDIAAYDIPF